MTRLEMDIVAYLFTSMCDINSYPRSASDAISSSSFFILIKPLVFLLKNNWKRTDEDIPAGMKEGTIKPGAGGGGRKSHSRAKQGNKALGRVRILEVNRAMIPSRLWHQVRRNRFPPKKDKGPRSICAQAPKAHLESTK